MRVVARLEDALDRADVVMTLRIQTERLAGAMIPSTREYARTFGLNDRVMGRAKPDAIVMHRGQSTEVGIASSVADGPQSVDPRPSRGGDRGAHGRTRPRDRGGRRPTRPGHEPLTAVDTDAPLGVFDSGLGGLTVVRALREALPSENIVYLGDTAGCRTGPRARPP